LDRPHRSNDGDNPGQDNPGQDGRRDLTRIASQEGLPELRGKSPSGREIPDQPNEAERKGDQPHQLTVQIEMIREIGTLPLPADNVTTRDGGCSARIGGREVYFFGDTLIYVPELQERQGHPWICIMNTAATAHPEHPFALREPLDANGHPVPFIQYDEREQRDENRRMDNLYAHAARKFDRPGEALMNREVIWPGSLISDGKDGGFAFCHKLTDSPDFAYTFQGVVVARVEVDGERVQATRQPELLFTYPEPSFVNAMVDKENVYLYGQLNGHKLEGYTLPPMALARAPLQHAAERWAYEFWDGQGWTKDVARVAPLMGDAPDAMTVSYNQHLGGYLAIHSELFTSHVMWRTAERPEGPWSEPEIAFTGQPPFPEVKYNGPNFNYAAVEHPALASENGKNIVVSYFNPHGEAYGKLRLVEVTLR
jgi:hypothetical protein